MALTEFLQPIRVREWRFILNDGDAPLFWHPALDWHQLGEAEWRADWERYQQVADMKKVRVHCASKADIEKYGQQGIPQT